MPPTARPAMEVDDRVGTSPWCRSRRCLWRRAEQAGIGRVHPHQFRHTFADTWTADERAREAHRRLSPETGSEPVPPRAVRLTGATSRPPDRWSGLEADGGGQQRPRRRRRCRTFPRRRRAARTRAPQGRRAAPHRRGVSREVARGGPGVSHPARPARRRRLGRFAGSERSAGLGEHLLEKLGARPSGAGRLTAIFDLAVIPMINQRPPTCVSARTARSRARPRAEGVVQKHAESRVRITCHVQGRVAGLTAT